MDAFITSAIVGTGQQRPETISTGTPIDRLIEQLPAHTLERNLLLAAGAWSVYRQAGYSARQLAVESKTAADETLSACSPKLANLIATLLQEEHASLLPEALERLQQRGLRIPYTLLPELLDYGRSKAAIRSALVPVLGERGRWLSHCNSRWHWVAQFPSKHSEPLPDDAETIWQEGASEAEQALLPLLHEDAHSWISPFLLLPTPCSHEFGLACLKRLQHHIDTQKSSYHYDDDWARIVTHIAKMLPPSCFAEAEALGSPAEQDTWINHQLHQMLNLFTKHIKLRTTLLEEIG